jgi:hypothetical protein
MARCGDAVQLTLNSINTWGNSIALADLSLMKTDHRWKTAIDNGQIYLSVLGGFVEFFGVEGFVGGCGIGFWRVGRYFEHRWNL